jgi:hypothetical protein
MEKSGAEAGGCTRAGGPVVGAIFLRHCSTWCGTLCFVGSKSDGEKSCDILRVQI